MALRKKMIFLLAVVLLVSGCIETSQPVTFEPDEMITREEFPFLDGSTSTLPLARLLMQRFTGISAEEAEVSLSFSKTVNSYWMLANNEADMLIVYEGSEATESYFDRKQLERKPIGRDALVFLTGVQNPVDSLSGEEIRSIYQGNITSWQEVGGRDTDIIPFQRNEDSGSHVLMLKLVMQDVPIMEPPAEHRLDNMYGVISELSTFDNGSACGVFIHVNCTMPIPANQELLLI